MRIMDWRVSAVEEEVVNSHHLFKALQDGFEIK